MTRILVGGLALVALVVAPAMAAPVVDGSAADAEYGPALAVQDNQTGYGTNKSASPNWGGGSQLDQVFGCVADGSLYLVFAGNLETNGNHLNLFFDTRAGGQNTIPGGGLNPVLGFNDPLERMGPYTGDPNDPNDPNGPGFTFTTGFGADYFLTISLTGQAGSYTDFAELYMDPNNPGAGYYIGAGSSACAYNGGTLIGGDPNAPIILVTFDDSNLFGVTGGEGVSDGTGTYTGVEIAIPLADLGNPSYIDCIAFIGNQDYGNVSNQFLGGLGGGGGMANLGEPGLIDLSTTSCAPFTVPMTGTPTPEVVGACVLPDGTCQLTTEAFCGAQFGTYQGDGTDCLTGLCSDTAACCVPEMACQVLTEFDCLTQGGTWYADVEVCDPNDDICTPDVYYAPGEANGWDNTTPMVDQGGGIHHYVVDGFVDPSPATTLFDILSIEGNWDSKVWAAGNQWLILDPNGDNTLILDTNTYADGWSPDTNRVGVAYEPSTSWTAVGDWQDQVGGGNWDPSNPNTTMTDEGGGLYSFSATLTPGSYNYKAVVTGTWEAIAGSSRNVNSDNFPFTVDAARGTVVMWVDVLNGAIKVDAGTPCLAAGDSNCDGFINNGDIDPFVLALGATGQADWEAIYSCDFICANDINGDTFVNNGDIDPFVALLGS